MSGPGRIHGSIAEESDRLIALSRDIHRNPELGGNERFASASICDYLAARGFAVTKGIGALDTAFVATYEHGVNGYHVAYCAEYDALPEIGHACGHNLIGIASVAAGVALAASASAEDVPFKVSVVGTPDEEGSGGKIDLIDAGVFNNVDVAMMFHPGYTTKIHVESLALQTYEFVFHGKNAHAASEPWEGRNALDAVNLMFHAVGALRQHVKDDVRIHGIIKEGGLATNIIPDRAVAEFCIRSLDNEYLQTVVDRVVHCGQGSAISTGTELEVRKVGHFYEAMKSNRVLEQVFSESLDDCGFVDRSRYDEGMGSIDMGNVSNVVPAIHPVLSLSEEMVLGHTTEFAALCNTQTAYEIMLIAGESMALTGYKVIQDEKLRQAIHVAFAG